jgi:hypothetical protein
MSVKDGISALFQGVSRDEAYKRFLVDDQNEGFPAGHSSEAREIDRGSSPKEEALASTGAASVSCLRRRGNSPTKFDPAANEIEQRPRRESRLTRKAGVGTTYSGSRC